MRVRVCTRVKCPSWENLLFEELRGQVLVLLLLHRVSLRAVVNAIQKLKEHAVLVLARCGLRRRGQRQAVVGCGVQRPRVHDKKVAQVRLQVHRRVLTGRHLALASDAAVAAAVAVRPVRLGKVRVRDYHEGGRIAGVLGGVVLQIEDRLVLAEVGVVHRGALVCVRRLVRVVDVPPDAVVDRHEDLRDPVLILPRCAVLTRHQRRHVPNGVRVVHNPVEGRVELRRQAHAHPSQRRVRVVRAVPFVRVPLGTLLVQQRHDEHPQLACNLLVQHVRDLREACVFHLPPQIRRVHLRVPQRTFVLVQEVDGPVRRLQQLVVSRRHRSRAVPRAKHLCEPRRDLHPARRCPVLVRHGLHRRVVLSQHAAAPLQPLVDDPAALVHRSRHRRCRRSRVVCLGPAHREAHGKHQNRGRNQQRRRGHNVGAPPAADLASLRTAHLVSRVALHWHTMKYRYCSF
eukprot:Rhum_TRINITY_DN4310_c0_g1::Rhum_TRINITY_DN4310_c0_g1_i1::g.13826::m.13826